MPLLHSSPPSGTEPLPRSLSRPIPRRRIEIVPEASAAAWTALRTRQVLNGPHRAIFEEAFARTIGTRWAIGVASARTGLYLTIKALGLKPEDEVICPAYTFPAMPAVLRTAGLIPVFVDADPVTCNMDPALIERAVTAKTRAILMTHLFGQPCEVESILEVARQKELKVIEDCAHAFGAEYRNQRVGSFGEVGLFSFGPGKNLPCFGGGMVTTNDDEIARRLRSLVQKGTTPSFLWLLREVIKTLGLAWGTGPRGFRLAGYPILRFCEALSPGMSDGLIKEPSRACKSFPPKAIRIANLQAAVGLEQLPVLDERNHARKKHAEILNEALADFPQLQLQGTLSYTSPIYLYYRILVNDREQFRRRLLRLRIDTKRDDMRNCGGPDFPVAERLARSSVELPNDPSLIPGEIQGIAAAVRYVLARRSPS